MANDFVRLICSQQTEQLLKDDPNAFLLLSIIALRSNRNKEPNSMGLEQGEAIVGDYTNYGLSRQEYRGAILRLRGNNQNNHRIVIRATTKGTIAKLVDNSIYDINAIANNHQDKKQKTNKTDLQEAV